MPIGVRCRTRLCLFRVKDGALLLLDQIIHIILLELFAEGRAVYRLALLPGLLPLQALPLFKRHLHAGVAFQLHLLDKLLGDLLNTCLLLVVVGPLYVLRLLALAIGALEVRLEVLLVH